MKRLKVEGVHFFDEDGHQVILNGINLVCKEKHNGYLEPNTHDLLHHYAKKDLIWFDWGSFGMELSRNQVSMMKLI